MCSYISRSLCPSLTLLSLSLTLSLSLPLSLFLFSSTPAPSLIPAAPLCSWLCRPRKPQVPPPHPHPPSSDVIVVFVTPCFRQRGCCSRMALAVLFSDGHRLAVFSHLRKRACWPACLHPAPAKTHGGDTASTRLTPSPPHRNKRRAYVHVSLWNIPPVAALSFGAHPPLSLLLLSNPPC